MLIVRGLYPPRPSLAQALAQLRRVPEPAPVLGPEADGGFAARLAVPRPVSLTRAGAGWLIPPRVRRDLAVLGRSPERHLAEKVTLALVGLLFAPAVAALSAPRRRPPVPSSCRCGRRSSCMVGGFVLPDLGIRAEAGTPSAGFPPRPRLVSRSRRRRPGRRRRGRDGADRRGRASATGWAFAYLRRALDQARLARETPWAALGRLGQELGVGELSELAASRRPGRHRGGQGPGLARRPRRRRCVPTSWPRPRPPIRPPPSA